MSGVWVVIIAIWLLVKIVEFFSGNSSKASTNIDRSKYTDRHIDPNKTLFERNGDIIGKFKSQITNRTYTYNSHYIENETRDCINEICLAENKLNIRPGYTYLSTWRLNAPDDWVKLSRQIEQLFEERRLHIQKIEEDVRKVSQELRSQQAKRVKPVTIQEIKKTGKTGQITLDDIPAMLKINGISWANKESSIIKLEGTSNKFQRFDSTEKTAIIKDLNKSIDTFNEQLVEDMAWHKKNKDFFEKILSGYKQKDKEEVVKRIGYVINDIQLPSSVPKDWQVDFDAEQGIVIVEVKLPDVVHRQIFKKIELKSGIVNKPLNQRETKEKVPNIHPAIMLRVAYEIFRSDVSNIIKLLIVNGWVEYDDPNTGVLTKTYTASLAVKKEQIMALNLSKIEPLSAFTNLKGKSAGKLIDIIPITPIMTLNKSDKRFIDTKEVLNELGSETNLASMDWQDFESLIAELFTKEFEKEGAEVKVTQASRDRGVDAVVFDPDPIKGGKFVIQAKRYTNTVDVSAVRDLCAVVKKEGASRGILVTTSTYGADAYAFANNEPVTLLNGAELLGLLKKHGYIFRINLAEARKINNANE